MLTDEQRTVKVGIPKSCRVAVDGVAGLATAWRRIRCAPGYDMEFSVASKMSKIGRGSGDEGHLGIKVEVSARGTGEEFTKGDVLGSFMRIEPVYT